MTQYIIHKDFRALKRLNFRLSSLEDVYEHRAVQENLHRAPNIYKNMTVQSTQIKGYNNTALSIELIKPQGTFENLPCILLFHGGGFMLGLTESHYRMACAFALELQCAVILPDYRLAPEHKFPWAVEDAYSSLIWAYSKAADIGIDPLRFAVVGESAGGNLAAATTLMSRNRKGPSISCQMLLYPALDCRQNTYSSQLFKDTPMFYTEANKFMWEQYLAQNIETIPEYASPSLAETLENLPPAYIETAEFDPLRDEGIDYAQRLNGANVHCILNNTKGTVHCFDLIRRSSITQSCFNARYDFLRKHL